MSDVMVFPQQAEEFMSALQLIQNKSKAGYVQLCHTAGSILAESGKFKGLDSSMFSALAAGSYSSTSTMAQILGEKEFHSIAHEGEKFSLHMTPIDGKALLILVFEKKKISKGLPKLIAKHIPALRKSLSLIGATSPIKR